MSLCYNIDSQPLCVDNFFYVKTILKNVINYQYRLLGRSLKAYWFMEKKIDKPGDGNQLTNRYL